MKTYKRTTKRHSTMYLVWVGGQFTAHKTYAAAERKAIIEAYKGGFPVTIERNGNIVNGYIVTP